jgi:hypothetical protein
VLVHVIAHCGSGDFGFPEVVPRLTSYLPDAEPVLTPAAAALNPQEVTRDDIR